jgi:hypothetical protein
METNMITVLLTDGCLDFKTRRYDTNSFDEAAKMLVDDWCAGEFFWEYDEHNEAFTHEWLKEYGYPNEDFSPVVNRETEVVEYDWYWHGETESEDHIIFGYFFKTAPVADDEWPTLGLDPGLFPKVDYFPE